MKMCYNNGELCLDSLSPSTDEEMGGLMLASAHPKKRAGRIKFKETRHPVYRGVRQRKSGKWVSEVRLPNNKSRLWLGTYLTPEMAARAHDVAAIALRGVHGACLNFSDSVWRLPVPESSNVKDIQRAAANAAKAFRPTIEAITEQNVVPLAEAALHEEIEVVYRDDDMVFCMPELLTDMYNGLGLSPPPNSSNYDYDRYVDDVELLEGNDMSHSLWSYSL